MPTKKLSQAATERIAQLRDRQKNPEAWTPVPTPIKDLNAILGGGLPRDNFYTAIIGKEKRGKTTFGFQFFLSYCESTGLKGILYNLEENEFQAADRAMAMRSTTVSRNNIFKLNITDDDFELLETIARDIHEYETYVNDNLYKLTEIFTDALQQKADVICIDNFQLITDGIGKDQREKLVYLSKELMRRRNQGLKIFLLSQGTDDGKSFGSTQVGMDADLCILMDHVYEWQGKKKSIINSLRALKVSQSRFSPTGECDVLFQPEYSRVRDVERKPLDPKADNFMNFEPIDLSDENEDDYDNDD